MRLDGDAIAYVHHLRYFGPSVNYTKRLYRDDWREHLGIKGVGDNPPPRTFIFRRGKGGCLVYTEEGLEKMKKYPYGSVFA